MTSIHRLIVIAGCIVVASAPVEAQAQYLETTMQLYRNGTLPTTKAPETNFTDDVYISHYVARKAPSRLVTATVTFAPGARTPWKVNPLGQTLIVTSGAGWAQCDGHGIVSIRTGDIIWYPPGERHWEGAVPDDAMSYIAIQEERDGESVQFSERVTDEEYLKGRTAD